MAVSPPTTHLLDVLFSPRSVVIVGANRERGKIGSEILHNLIATGFTGRIAVVHPAGGEIDGVQAYVSARDIPWELDLAVICVPAACVLAAVDDCLARGAKALIVISAGFSEAGADGRARERELVARIRAAGLDRPDAGSLPLPRVRLVGPNCMGVINTDPNVRLNVTFAPTSPPPGRVAMSTQSGALGLAILEYARELHIGFSTFVSVGNKADVSSNDLLEYWAEDPRTDVILLYLESFGNPRRFSRIAPRVSRVKPIIAVKAGRSAAGARAAASHTGALASSDRVVDALFRQAGVVRTSTLEELFDVATLLAHQPTPRGRRVGILTNAGGPGILAADACEAYGLVLPALSASTTTALKALLPASASVGNPVDMLASATAAQYEAALTTMLQDDELDSVLVIFIPPLVTKDADVAQAVQRAAFTHPGKTIAGIFMSAKGAPPALAPIPCFRYRDAVRSIVSSARTRGNGWLDASSVEALLDAAGIQGASGELAATEDTVLAAANRIGYPVVLKAIGPDILHKSDVGGVITGLESAQAVRRAWRDLRSRLGSRLTCALVQEMVTGGVEMLIGMTEDPAFGPVIACAMGGTLTEILNDAAVHLHPLTDRDAADLVDSLHGAPLLRGYRGGPPVDEAALRECLLRLSVLIDLCPEIRELDVNPLRVLPRGARALDARIRMEFS